MIKDIFILKKSSYHCRMMKYIWNLNYYDFSHMCPYWWLSVANHLLFIEFFVVKESLKLIRLFFKILGKILVSAYKFIADIIEEFDERQREIWEKKEAKRWRERFDQLSRDPEQTARDKIADAKFYKKLFEKIKKYHYSDFIRFQDKVWEYEQVILEELSTNDQKLADERSRLEEEKEKKKFLLLYKGEKAERMLENGMWRRYLLDYENTKKRTEEQEEAARRRIAKERVVKLLKIIKPCLTILAYTAGTAAILFGGYWLMKFFIWSWEGINRIIRTTNWNAVGHNITTGLTWIGIVVGAIVVLAGIILAIRYTINKKSIKINWYKLFTPVRWFGKVIIIKPCQAIKNAFIFVKEMLKNNCPAIKWED